MRNRLSHLFAAALLATFGGSASAALTYDYQGPAFSTIQDPTLGASITATVVLQPWIPADFTGPISGFEIASYVISSGPFNVGGPQCQRCYAFLSLTDGQVTSWYLEYFAQGSRDALELSTCGPAGAPPGSCYTAGDSVTKAFTVHATNLFWVNSTPSTGSWTLQAVPEPSEYALLGAAIITLLALRVRGNRAGRPRTVRRGLLA